jgi:hypothetical protein
MGAVDWWLCRYVVLLCLGGGWECSNNNMSEGSAGVRCRSIKLLRFSTLG